MTEFIPLTIEEQRKYILDKVNSQVVFNYPDNNRGKLKGIIENRTVVFDADNKDDGVVYWNIVDTIKFEKEPEKWVRFTYYRYKYKPGKNILGKNIRLGWNFAGQTSLSDPISKIKELLETALKEQPHLKILMSK